MPAKPRKSKRKRSPSPVERHPNENPSGIKLEELNSITPSALLAKCEDSGDTEMIETVLNRMKEEVIKLKQTITDRIKRRKITEKKKGKEEEGEEEDKQWKLLIAERAKNRNPLEQLWNSTITSQWVKGLLRDRSRLSEGNAEDEIVWRGVVEAYRFLERMGAIHIRVPIETTSYKNMEITSVYLKPNGTTGELSDYTFYTDRWTGNGDVITESARWKARPDGRGYFSNWGLILNEHHIIQQIHIRCCFSQVCAGHRDKDDYVFPDEDAGVFLVAARTNPRTLREQFTPDLWDIVLLYLLSFASWCMPENSDNTEIDLNDDWL